MDKALAKKLYMDMYKIRRFEQEVFEFYKTGQMAGMAHLYIGEEAAMVGMNDTSITEGGQYKLVYTVYEEP